MDPNKPITWLVHIQNGAAGLHNDDGYDCERTSSLSYARHQTGHLIDPYIYRRRTPQLSASHCRRSEESSSLQKESFNGSYRHILSARLVEAFNKEMAPSDIYPRAVSSLPLAGSLICTGGSLLSSLALRSLPSSLWHVPSPMVCRFHRRMRFVANRRSRRRHLERSSRNSGIGCRCHRACWGRDTVPDLS